VRPSSTTPGFPWSSATGSTAMGRAVAPKLAQRFARAILELGGNNAAVVTPTADLDLTLRGVCVCGNGHGRPALHHPAPTFRSRERLMTASCRA